MVVPNILGIGLTLLGAALGIVRLTDERPRISDMGQSRPFDDVRATSGLRSETDIVRPAPGWSIWCQNPEISAYWRGTGATGSQTSRDVSCRFIVPHAKNSQTLKVPAEVR
jgi:hypothetical protein